MTFTCTVCTKIFQHNYGLRRHYRKMHPSQSQPEALASGRKKTTTSTRTFTCSVCGKVFGCQTSLWRHKKIHLPPGSAKSRDKVKMNAADRKILRFPSTTVFYQWKKTQEDAYTCRFVKFNKDRKCNKGTRVLYRCHRSGFYRPRGKGVRRLKVQGTCKIGGVCPATMYTIIHDSGEVTVNYCETHVGHGPGKDYIVHRWTRHLRGIHKQHRLSEAMDPAQCVCTVDNSVFSVSGSNGKSYRVEKCTALPHAGHACAFECKDCKICIHAFICSCRENTSRMKRSICKHIHLVVRTFYGSEKSSHVINQGVETSNNIVYTDVIARNVVQNVPEAHSNVDNSQQNNNKADNNSLQNKLQSVREMCSFVMNHVEEHADDLIDIVHEHFMRAATDVSVVLENKLRHQQASVVTCQNLLVNSTPLEYLKDQHNLHVPSGIHNLRKDNSNHNLNQINAQSTLDKNSESILNRAPIPPPNKLPIPPLNRPPIQSKRTSAKKVAIRKVETVMVESAVHERPILLEAIPGAMEVIYSYPTDDVNTYSSYISPLPEQMRYHHHY